MSEKKLFSGIIFSGSVAFSIIWLCLATANIRLASSVLFPANSLVTVRVYNH